MSSTVLEPPVVAPQPANFADAGVLIETLRASAARVLGSALGSAPLVAFQVGSQGSFPYYWQNPATLDFNHLTYQWINSNLAANSKPVAQDQLFTDLYIQALSAISYSLSNADLAKLNKGLQDATDQQAALLTEWKQQYGSLPPATPGRQPIDVILATITNEWAAPPTDVEAMQMSDDLNGLLNRTPASGKPVLPVLADYLEALGESISLLNATAMNTGYLIKARSAVQKPTVDNGGLKTDDGLVRPAYQVSTRLADILNGLKATNNAVSVKMSVVRTSATEYTVSVSGGASFRVPIGFLTVSTGSSTTSYFSDSIATSENKVEITMTFPGVTIVNFGPVPFDASSGGKNWFWMFPITQAIANGTKDVTGFKFSLDPRIDFSPSGPFGFLQGVAISNYPSMQIVVTSSQYQKIHQDFSSQSRAGVRFLGIPLGGGGSASTYSSSTTVDAASQNVTITLDPPQEIIAGTQATSVGWVLGVQTSYPAA